jgi:hypothetical protein
VSSETSILDLFFGKVSHFLMIKSAEKQRSKLINSVVEKMGPIMLDVNNHDNFYDAWSATMCQSIEGYNGLS